MILDEYRTQFKRNLMVMHSAYGVSDASAGSAEDVPILIYENVDRAIVFLYENRRRNFKSAKELEEMVLEMIRITNNGIIRNHGLFLSGAESIRFNYVRSKDIPEFWYWFTRGLLRRAQRRPCNI